MTRNSAPTILITTLIRLSQRLNNLSVIFTQVEQGSRRRLNVSEEWEKELEDLEDLLFKAHQRLIDHKKEVGAYIGVHKEEQGALEVSVDSIKDAQQIIGERGEYLTLLYAEDEENLAEVIKVSLGLISSPMTKALALLEDDERKLLFELLKR